MANGPYSLLLIQLKDCGLEMSLTKEELLEHLGGILTVVEGGEGGGSWRRGLSPSQVETTAATKTAVEEIKVRRTAGLGHSTAHG